MPLNEDDVKKLAGLARIEVSEKEVKELVDDLGKILGHFDELKEVDTNGILPICGGISQVNIHRHDEEDIKLGTLEEKLVNSFPEKEGTYLKVPPVFQ